MLKMWPSKTITIVLWSWTRGMCLSCWGRLTAPRTRGWCCWCPRVMTTPGRGQAGDGDSPRWLASPRPPPWGWCSWCPRVPGEPGARLTWPGNMASMETSSTPHWRTVTGGWVTRSSLATSGPISHVARPLTLLRLMTMSWWISLLCSDSRPTLCQGTASRVGPAPRTGITRRSGLTSRTWRETGARQKKNWRTTLCRTSAVVSLTSHHLRWPADIDIEINSLNC